jgi:hypothetical protein
MTVVIQIIAPAFGHDPEMEGKYVKEYDPDANDGLGFVLGVLNPEEAKKFDSAGDALRFYRQVSTVRPVRPDGKPNRPLTAYTISIETFREIH